MTLKVARITHNLQASLRLNVVDQDTIFMLFVFAKCAVILLIWWSVKNLGYKPSFKLVVLSRNQAEHLF